MTWNLSATIMELKTGFQECMFVLLPFCLACLLHGTTHALYNLLLSSPISNTHQKFHRLTIMHPNLSQYISKKARDLCQPAISGAHHCPVQHNEFSFLLTFYGVVCWQGQKLRSLPPTLSWPTSPSPTTRAKCCIWQLMFCLIEALHVFRQFAICCV